MRNMVAGSRFGTEIKSWAKGYKRSWDDLSWVRRAYWIGLMLVIGALLALAINKSNAVGSGVMTAGTLLLSLAMAYECYIWLKPKLDSRLLTLSIGVPTAIGGVVAMGLAADAINAATDQDPATFGHTQALLSLLMVFPLSAYAIVFLSLVALIVVAVAGFLGVYRTRDKEQERQIWVGIGRLLAVVFTATLANHMVQPNSLLDPRFPRLAAWSAYAMDMHIDPSCSSNPGDRIARLNDDLVVVGRESSNGYEFFRADCALTAQKGISP